MRQRRRLPWLKVMIIEFWVLLMTFFLVCYDSKWVVDSGAYYHASPRRESFCIYQSGQFGVFKMGKKGTIEIVGIDNVKIKTNLGT